MTRRRSLAVAAGAALLVGALTFLVVRRDGPDAEPSARTTSTSAPRTSVSAPPSPTSAPDTTSEDTVTTTEPVRRDYPWHTNIVATTFWVGELFDETLADGSQVCSTYDSQWAYHWSGIDRGRVPDDAPGCAGAILGGCDGIWTAGGRCETEPRTAENDFFPSSATPLENPFYLDLPYDDLHDPIGFARRCEVIPWAHDPGYDGRCGDRTFSFMKNRWVRIVGPNGATCYGQIQDAGPSHDDLYHDVEYVFGADDARPRQRRFNNAGMDVSPAINGCLGFRDLDGARDRVSWQFVERADVPDGPWTRIETVSGVT